VGSAAIIHSDATQEPLLNLAPKKVNWDLKRDMEPQMKKLRAMTDRAIIQIIRE
jgi:coiled-coil domain-containing protein 12